MPSATPTATSCSFPVRPGSATCCHLLYTHSLVLAAVAGHTSHQAGYNSRVLFTCNNHQPSYCVSPSLEQGEVPGHLQSPGEVPLSNTQGPVMMQLPILPDRLQHFPRSSYYLSFLMRRENQGADSGTHVRPMGGRSNPMGGRSNPMGGRSNPTERLLERGCQQPDAPRQQHQCT